MIAIRSGRLWWSMVLEEWTPNRRWACEYDTFEDCPAQLPSPNPQVPGTLYRTGPGFTEGYFMPGHGPLVARPEEVTS